MEETIWKCFVEYKTEKKNANSSISQVAHSNIREEPQGMCKLGKTPSKNVHQL